MLVNTFTPTVTFPTVLFKMLIVVVVGILFTVKFVLFITVFTLSFPLQCTVTLNVPFPLNMLKSWSYTNL